MDPPPLRRTDPPRIYLDYPTESLIAAAEKALAYGLLDLGRLETMVLRAVAGGPSRCTSGGSTSISMRGSSDGSGPRRAGPRRAAPRGAALGSSAVSSASGRWALSGCWGLSGLSGASTCPNTISVS